jgi:hypothetical protein
VTRSKLPQDAFDFFFALGPSRSHAAVAKHFAVSRKTVARRAADDGWERRVVELEKKAREASEKRAIETVEQLNERHLKVLKVLQGKALEALRNMSMDKPADVIRALEVSIRQERAIRGIGDEGVGVQVNVNSRTVQIGPPIPSNDTLGRAIGRLGELARAHGLNDAGLDAESES